MKAIVLSLIIVLSPTVALSLDAQTQDYTFAEIDPEIKLLG